MGDMWRHVGKERGRPSHPFDFVQDRHILEKRTEETS